MLRCAFVCMRAVSRRPPCLLLPRPPVPPPLPRSLVPLMSSRVGVAVPSRGFAKKLSRFEQTLKERQDPNRVKEIDPFLMTPEEMMKIAQEKEDAERPRLNDEIVGKFLLIDEDGSIASQEIDAAQALPLAKAKGLDLVEVHKNDKVHVVKMIQYSKYKLLTKKATKVANKAQKEKEIRFSSQISEHDVQIKVRNLRKLILENTRVRVVITFKELQPDSLLASEMIQNILERVGDVAKIEGATQKIKSGR
eukprot:TRINITY_DN3602_c0_g2_i2.p1 TRINITY_DN3602_c0_g2~~TRINITY_DN3602_c0_g2_i2.p1  ORF type:complete len:250 (+),score=71.92 TRINITY_DN3602_c0_g2_i2:41-790(+)